MKTNLLLLLCLLLTACQEPNKDIGIAQNYLPETKLLATGVVNKFYTHHKLKEQHDIYTDINYKLYQKRDTNLIIKDFRSDFTRQSTQKCSFEANKMIVSQEEWYTMIGDTLGLTIKQPIEIDWTGLPCTSEKTLDRDNNSSTFLTSQKQMRDTMVLDRPAKIIEGEIQGRFSSITDTTVTNASYKAVYVQDIGLYSYFYKDERRQSTMELVEQIPLATFQELANHGKHRVAYIDPALRLDKNNNFQPCQPNVLNDYYNGGIHFVYKAGRKALKQLVYKQLNPIQLQEESGYLTFRFVVNCKGEAGRFVTEQTNLDFQKKQFNQQTIDHFYRIVSSLKDWHPTTSRKKIVDAYGYLTFKLQDGNLIEILP